MAAVDIRQRRAWDGAALVILVGPGGAGKTTLGHILAPMTGRALVDLDQAFLDALGDIGDYIRSAGYAAYKAANSALAGSLASDLRRPTILVTSSGFLASDNPAEVLADNIGLLAQGYSISLLPHADLEAACDIIADRQLRRGLYRDADRQRQIIRERFDLYKAAGDMQVISTAAPAEIAEAVARQMT